MSWGAQNRSKDAKNPSVAGVRSQKPEPGLWPVQPYSFRLTVLFYRYRPNRACLFPLSILIDPQVLYLVRSCLSLLYLSLFPLYCRPGILFSTLAHSDPSVFLLASSAFQHHRRTQHPFLCASSPPTSCHIRGCYPASVRPSIPLQFSLPAPCQPYSRRSSRATSIHILPSLSLFAISLISGVRLCGRNRRHSPLDRASGARVQPGNTSHDMEVPSLSNGQICMLVSPDAEGQGS
jgi:hypothetical protein